MRILLIAPAFYDYHYHIVRELKRCGHEVRLFAERPNRWIYSPAKKLPARWCRAVFDRYLWGLLRKIKGEMFNRVLLIRGEIVAPWFIQELRVRNPGARIVMYQWDSVRNNDYRALLSYVDSASTFDPKDADHLGINYLPLFHIAGYRLQKAPKISEWDLVFVGSFSKERYRTLLNIREHCHQRGIRLRHYLYLAPVDYWKLRLLGQAPARNDVEFRKLDQDTVINLYGSASCILDIENDKQTGLTMRSFEALATGRILVTTNSLAIELLPELKDRILIIDRNYLDLSPDLLKEAPGWSDVLMVWSIEAWACQLMES